MTPSPAAPAYDCRHFLGDRPCGFHKRSGVSCTCDHYDRVTERVLVVKLDAMGDVLRTTALLPPLAAAHPHAAIDWVTRPESVPLLDNNPFLADVIPYGPDALARVRAVRYDRVVNLDAGKVSASLAALADSPRKDGYVLDPRGFVVPTNPAAAEWLRMGTDDRLKRANQTRTYQSIMLGILGLAGQPHRYVLDLRPAERAWADRHLAGLGLDPNRPVVGLNVGAGGRWELKKWRLDGFAELAERVYARGAQVLLLGGRAEAERHAELADRSAVPLADAGTGHDLRRFAALVGRADVLVTGDTLAMHMAIAQERRTVVLFGPTSHAEIDLYGLGEKVFPAMACLGCYKSGCDYAPNCMDLISTDAVVAAVTRQLAAVAPAAKPARPAVALPVVVGR